MNRETVYELKKLYEELSSLDEKIKAMLSKTCQAETPLQKVTFFMLSGGFSGPMDYEPKHTCKALVAIILHDMQITRGLITLRIQALGFETNPAPTEDQLQ